MVNSNKSTSIKLSLFFIFKSLYLYINFNIVDFLNIITYKQTNKKNYRYFGSYTINMKICVKIFN